METQPHLPPGTSLTPNWITPPQEAALIAFLYAGAWSGELKRRVRHFGYRYDYRARRATGESRIGPLPDMLQGLAERLVADGRFAAVPDQVIANEYLPGQGISAHVDCEPCFGEVIASLSLLSACEMRFASLSSGETRAVICRRVRCWCSPGRRGVSGRMRSPRGCRMSLTVCELPDSGGCR